MTFVLVIFDLKDLAANIQTQGVDEYTSETITRTSKQYPVERQEMIAGRYHHNDYAKIKTSMLARGYTDKAHTTKSQLPHNCLIKDNISQQQAIADLIEVVKKHDAALESYMAVTVNSSYQADASLL
jgi:hypothetical protein